VTTQDHIALSAVAETWGWLLGAPALALALVTRVRAGRDARALPSLDAPLSPGAERWLLALVVAVGAFVRVVAWDSDATPPYWFTEVATLYVEPILREHRFLPTWLDTLHRIEVAEPHDSAFVLPVHAALQALLGPRFGIPLLSGAVFGILAVPLAWALGRRVRSPAFGLTFAAFVACSPLLLTWSRVNALCSAAVPHVLLVTLLGWEAGRRRSVLLAVLTGAVAWTSVYLYYAARLGIPLAFAAMLAGGQRAGALRRATVLVAAAVLAFVVTGSALRGETLTPTALWPSYGGYAGNKGEQTLREFLAENLGSIATELGHTIERCFAMRRTGWDRETPLGLPGVQYGGLWIAPFALLGLVGLVSTLRNLRRQWLWVALAAAGLALPALSTMTARRVLIFDLAWCAFAAHGLFSLIDVLAVRATLPTRQQVATLLVTAIGAWSIGAVFVLNDALPRGAGAQIPFGDAGFGDGVTCRRCLDAAHGWRAEMCDGAFLVLFDNDVPRENRTSPGGLVAYGKIATLVAGTPGRIAEAYELMAGIDAEPPRPGAVFDRATIDWVTYLETQIERTSPSRVVWHFERPTAWERWLAGRLVAAGGVAETFETPLSPTPGLRVVTPRAQLSRALGVLRELVAGLAPGADSRCLDLVPDAAFDIDQRVLFLAADGGGVETAPSWLVGSFGTHYYKSSRFTAPLMIGGTVTPVTPGTERIDVFGRLGEHVVYEIPSLRREDPPAISERPHGLNCGAYAAGAWWALDPWTGEVESTHPNATMLPKGDWIGITTDGAGMLVLASASQSILVFDPAHGTEITRFPARVSPAVREFRDECSPIAAGADWIATVDLRSTVLSVYDSAGRDFGTRRLDRFVGPRSLSTIGGGGRWLAVGVETSVKAFELRKAATCSGARVDDVPAPDRG
jgi:hypothetical protein